MTLEHSPDQREQLLLDALLERFHFEPVLIRLTQTMLEKSIIDARGPIRALLRSSGLVDYSMIGQGEEHKVVVQLPFITTTGVQPRPVSFYRPSTKQGDPRVWVAKLSSVAKAGDLLVFVFSGTSVAVLLLKGQAEALCAGAAPYLVGRHEDRATLEGAVRRLTQLLAPLAQKWVPTQRAGPTGVGYTLESLLGISANVRQVADVDGVELKAYRRGAVSGSKLITLFSKTPAWVGSGRGGELLKRFGYLSDDNRNQLYCSVTCAANSLGWRLEVRPDEGRILVHCHNELGFTYSLSTLSRRLREKHPATLFVRALYKGQGKHEEFCFNDVTYCSEPSFANFLDLIAENLVCLDLTLSTKANGGARDHGYLWRIKESSIVNLYAYRKVLIAGPS